MSTRRVDDLFVALGGTGISKSEVSRICAQLKADVAAWRSRPLDEQAFPCVFCDATYCKVCVGGRVVSPAVAIATGVSADAAAIYSAAPSRTARPKASGPTSCAACATARSVASSWSSVTATAA